MNILNLCDLQNSSIGYKLHVFPDGEKQIELLDSTKDIDLDIFIPIRNSDELFIAAQALELTKNAKSRRIVFTYLMGGRNDRKMAEGRAVNLELVLKILDMGLRDSKDDIVFIGAHNPSKIAQILNRPIEFRYLENVDANVIVFPDEGAYRRFSNLTPKYFTVAEKVRNLDTGWILSYEIDVDILQSAKDNGEDTIYIIDDLVDGGSTFKMLHESLKPLGMKVILMATHFIQPDKLLELAELYDEIQVSDQFTKLPVHPKIKLGII